METGVLLARLSEKHFFPPLTRQAACTAPAEYILHSDSDDYLPLGSGHLMEGAGLISCHGDIRDIDCTSLIGQFDAKYRLKS